MMKLGRKDDLKSWQHTNTVLYSSCTRCKSVGILKWIRKDRDISRQGDIWSVSNCLLCVGSVWLLVSSLVNKYSGWDPLNVNWTSRFNSSFCGQTSPAVYFLPGLYSPLPGQVLAPQSRFGDKATQILGSLSPKLAPISTDLLIYFFRQFGTSLGGSRTHAYLFFSFAPPHSKTVSYFVMSKTFLRTCVYSPVTSSLAINSFLRAEPRLLSWHNIDILMI